QLLLNWKMELMEEVDRTMSHMKDEAANFPDPADRASQEEEFSLELRTRDRERKLIKKIDSTMELIENDDYGFCNACGVEIGIRRLEARPTATLCVDCKTLDEIKEKQIGGGYRSLKISNNASIEILKRKLISKKGSLRAPFCFPAYDQITRRPGSRHTHRYRHHLCRTLRAFAYRPSAL